ncbi:MAG: extracellular solute-binding protein [Chloroflexi bacterium]|nr:extracellular solute-binding protein [Chloroflexota bacterium]
METQPDSASPPRPFACELISFLFNHLNPANESAAEAAIANLKSLTGISVNPDFSRWWEYWDRQRTRRGPSGNPVRRWPDIWQGNRTFMSAYALIGKVLALDDYVASWGDWDDYYPEVREDISFAGHVQGLPYSAHYRGSVVFRPSMFESAGLPEEPPETWEELNEIAPKLTKTDGEVFEQAGFNLQHHAQVYEDWLLQAGGRAFNPDLTRPTNNTPEGRSALNQHVRHGLIEGTMPKAGMDSEDPYLHTFGAGRVAIQMLWPGNVGNCETLAPKVFADLAVGRPFAGPHQRAMHLYTNSFWVSSSTKVPDAVFEVLKYFSSPARNYEVTVSGDRTMPCRRAMENFEIYRSEPWNSFSANMKFARLRQLFPEHLEVQPAMSRWVEKAGLGEVAVADALRGMDDEVSAIISDS